MNNRHLKKLNSLKKHSISKLFHKRFKLPYLNISSTYHHYSKDVFNIMDEIYQELKVDSLICDFFAGKEVNYTERKPALHHRYRDLSKKDDVFDSISASDFFFF